MARHRASWWAKRVDELSNGVDAGDIARRHGVRERTLVWWRSELARRARDDRACEPRLLPVVVRDAPAAKQGSTLDVVVEVGAARVTVHGALTADQLIAIVRAACGC